MQVIVIGSDVYIVFICLYKVECLAKAAKTCEGNCSDDIFVSMGLWIIFTLVGTICIPSNVVSTVCLDYEGHPRNCQSVFCHYTLHFVTYHVFPISCAYRLFGNTYFGASKIFGTCASTVVSSLPFNWCRMFYNYLNVTNVVRVCSF